MLSPEEMRQLLMCTERVNGCQEPVAWVVEWRKDYYDPYLTGRDHGFIANNACIGHLPELIKWISKDWDGHMHVMSSEFYLYARIQGREASTGEGLGACWRWPRVVTET